MRGRREIWRCRDRQIAYGDRTLVMGILNVTPDSFFDGGALADVDAAIQRARQMAAAGADLLDVGGESTRPGSDEVPAPEEIARVVPVIERLTDAVEVPISVDTRKADVAAAAVDAGACIVNDVTAGADPRMFEVVREADAGMVLMHMQGEPKTMQDNPHYDDVVGEVCEFLRERVEDAEHAGVAFDRLCVDPGLGFGKTLGHNLLLLHETDRLAALGLPLLVGPSRKRFLGAILGSDDPGERLEGTSAAVAWLAAHGADIVRVHDVPEMVRVVRVVDAISAVGS
jgi:dihydropteroate synthase